MDWLYAVTGQSLAEAPDHLLPGYKSTAQRYDLYAPRPAAIGTPMPLVLFISYKNDPMGWRLLGQTCFREGVIYVEPHKAGNSIPTAERVRIVLDSLDDVRRRYPIDPPIVVLEDQIDQAGLTLDRYVNLQCDQMPINAVLYAALTPIGLSYRYENGRVEILPISDIGSSE